MSNEIQDDNQPVKTSAKKELTRGAATRLGMMGMLGTGALLGAACSGKVSTLPVSAQQTYADSDILNFALNLEYLESEFYYSATTGSGIAAAGIGTSGTGTAGATTGGVKTAFTNTTAQNVALQITQDEGTHVTLLRGVLGPLAVAKPAIDLSAGGMFNFSTQSVFLQLSRSFEDTGVSAYGGAAPLISSKTYLQVAAQILSIEAYHASNIRLMIAQMGITTSQTDSQDVLPPPSGASYFCETGALSIIRTFAEVLAIVKPFFPAGLNGTIH